MIPSYTRWIQSRQYSVFLLFACLTTTQKQCYRIELKTYVVKIEFRTAFNRDLIR